MSLYEDFKKLFKIGEIADVPIVQYSTPIVPPDNINFTPDVFNSLFMNNIISRVSTDMSRINLKHIKTLSKNGDGYINEVQQNSDISYVLNTSPNEYDTPSRFWSSVIVEMMLNRFAIVMPEFENGSIKSLTLIKEYSVKTKNKNVYFEINGKNWMSSELIIFKDILNPLNSYRQAFDKIIGEALAALSYQYHPGNHEIKGFFKLKENMGDVQLQKLHLKRINDMIKMAGSNKGYGYLHTDESFQELQRYIPKVEGEQLEFLKNQLYESFGINGDILSGNFDEKSYNAYLLNVIKPYQQMIAQELTKKLFTKSQIQEGHKIIYSISIMESVSMMDFASASKDLKYAAIMSSNEIRSEIGYESYIGGDRFETNANAIAVVPNEQDIKIQEEGKI